MNKSSTHVLDQHSQTYIMYMYKYVNTCHMLIGTSFFLSLPVPFLHIVSPSPAAGLEESLTELTLCLLDNSSSNHSSFLLYEEEGAWPVEEEGVWPVEEEGVWSVGTRERGGREGEMDSERETSDDN